MKKIFRYITVFSLFILSLYYTNRVAEFVKYKNPVMQNIIELQESKKVLPVNSEIIEKKYIIPGINGKEINVNATFINNKKFKKIEEDKIVFNEIKPKLSLEENKDKIILRGNENKNAVSLIFTEVNTLTKFMHQNNYKVNVLIDSEKYDLNYELINNSKNEITHKNIDRFLTKNKINKNICFTKQDVISTLCTNKYNVKNSMTINHTNLSINKDNIKSGEIILVENTISLTELNILLNCIYYENLKVIPLSELISESNQ